MTRIKVVLAGTVFAFGMIIVLQNTEPVSTRILFYTITMPRAILLFGTTCIGFTLGILLPYFTRRDKKINVATENGPENT